MAGEEADDNVEGDEEGEADDEEEDDDKVQPDDEEEDNDKVEPDDEEQGDEDEDGNDDEQLEDEEGDNDESDDEDDGDMKNDDDDGDDEEGDSDDENDDDSNVNKGKSVEQKVNEEDGEEASGEDEEEVNEDEDKDESDRDEDEGSAEDDKKVFEDDASGEDDDNQTTEPAEEVSAEVEDEAGNDDASGQDDQETATEEDKAASDEDNAEGDDEEEGDDKENDHQVDEQDDGNGIGDREGSDEESSKEKGDENQGSAADDDVSGEDDDQDKEDEEEGEHNENEEKKKDEDKDEGEGDGSANGDGKKDDDMDEDTAADENESNTMDDQTAANEVPAQEGTTSQGSPCRDDEDEPAISHCSQTGVAVDGSEVDYIDDGSSEVLHDDYDEETGDNYLLHSDTTQEWMRVMDPCYGCTLDCGVPAPDVILVSAAMVQHEKLMLLVLRLRKETIDYCLIDDEVDLKETEKLAKYHCNMFLTKEDTVTLVPGEILSSVLIECWSLLLNELIFQKLSSDKPTRIFMGMNHVIFIPLSLEDHYFAACINFMSQRVEYLDNKPFFVNSRKVKMARIAANIMGNLLKQIGCPKGPQVESYPIHNIKFKWQTKESNVDSGVFLMFHMALFYTGNLFDCDLTDAHKRILYRAEICAILILSDMNQERTTVLKRISEFSSKREQLRKKLLHKRKDEDRKEKEEERKGVAVKVKRVEEQEKVPRNKSVVRRSPRLYISLIDQEQELKIRSLDDDGMGCSLDCGICDDNMFLVSEFMKANKTVLSTTSNLRREVLDYAFLDDEIYDKGEILAVFANKMKVTREDILSLQPKCHTNWMLFECWSLLLNNIENTKRSSCRKIPVILHLGIRHMTVLREMMHADSEEGNLKDELFAIWDAFIADSQAGYKTDADLIFIPCLVENHYFCVCLNFLHKQTTVLDNQSYSKWENSYSYSYAALIAGCMSDYLQLKRHSKALEVINYPVVNMNFEWQSRVPNHKESGCMIITVVSNYDGSPYKSLLGNKWFRRAACALIAACLLLADINIIRADLLEVVGSFIKCKPKLWPEIYERRQKAIAKAAEEAERTKKEEPDKQQPKKVNTEIPILRLKIKNN